MAIPSFCNRATAALLIAFISFSASAKDPCNSIRRKYDQRLEVTSFTSPQSAVTASKWITAGGSSVYLNFVIKGKAVSPVVRNADPATLVVKGLYVTFDDGSGWHSDTVIVNSHDFAGVRVYDYALKLDEESYRLFRAKKIRQFSLGEFTESRISQAAFIPEYLKCLWEGAAFR